jgi:hypothetical protein
MNTITAQSRGRPISDFTDSSVIRIKIKQISKSEMLIAVKITLGIP